MKNYLKLLCAVICLCVVMLPMTALATVDAPITGNSAAEQHFGIAGPASASKSASASASASAADSAAASDTATDPNPETGANDVIGLVGGAAVLALLGCAIAYKKN